MKINNYYINFLIELLKIDSSTTNIEGVNSVGMKISKKLKKLGFIEKKYQKKDTPTLFTFKTKENLNDKPILLISGHLDTVLPTSDTEVKADNKWIYGSGANDMKGGLTAMIYALNTYNEIYGGINNIIITLTPDEETGSKAYSSVLAEIYKKADYALVLEGKGDHGEICTARRGISLLYLNVKGKAGHSGHFGNIYPNAIDEAAYIVNKIVNLADPKNGISINTGTIKGGRAVNVVAENCDIELDIRYSKNWQYENTIRKIKNIVKNKKFKDSKIKFVITKVFPPMEEVTKNNNFLAIVTTAYKNLGKALKTEKRYSASDANHIQQQGIGVLDGFGTQGKYIHTKEERVLKDSIFQSGIIIKEVINEIVGYV
jgi:glutamate carboxypeptidase